MTKSHLSNQVNKKQILKGFESYIKSYFDFKLFGRHISDIYEMSDFYIDSKDNLTFNIDLCFDKFELNMQIKFISTGKVGKCYVSDYISLDGDKIQIGEKYLYLTEPVNL